MAECLRCSAHPALRMAHNRTELYFENFPKACGREIPLYRIDYYNILYSIYRDITHNLFWVCFVLMIVCVCVCVCVCLCVCVCVYSGHHSGHGAAHKAGRPQHRHSRLLQAR